MWKEQREIVASFTCPTLDIFPPLKNTIKGRCYLWIRTASPYFPSARDLRHLAVEKVEEIRLRCGRPVEIVLHEGICGWASGGELLADQLKPPCPL